MFDDQKIRDIHRHSIGIGHSHIHAKNILKPGTTNMILDTNEAAFTRSTGHRHNHSERDIDYYYYYYLHHVHKDKDKHKHRRVKSSSIIQQVHLDRRKNDDVGHQKHRRPTETIERPLKMRLSTAKRSLSSDLGC